MFEDSLVESARHFEKRRGWSALAVTLGQAAALALVIALPLLRVQQLAAGARLSPLPLPVEAPEPQHVSAAGSANSLLPSAVHEFRQPSSVPQRIYSGPAPEAPAIHLDSCSGNCLPMIEVPGAGSRPVLQPGRTTRPIISHLDAGQILRQIQPVYPAIAKAAGIEGTVVLRAIIGRTGDIEHLQVVSGHPMLARAAEQAVSQWKFRPYLLNGSAVEVETEITVNFRLNR